MNKSKKKVVHIVGKMNRGGQETFIMNVFRAIEKNKYDFNFIVFDKDRGHYDDEIERMGGRIFRVEISKSKYLLIRSVKRFFDVYSYFKGENDIDIIHIHTANSMCVIELLAAKCSGIKTRIVHSHNTKAEKGGLHTILRPFMNLLATHYLGCSVEANNWMFGERNKHTIVIPNGVNLNSFLYNKNLREKIRSELDLENSIVYGHIGRFNEQKNHNFLIEIFYNLYQKDNNSILLLIGDGELMDNIVKRIIEMNLQGNVKFLGIREDINEVLNAMDYFIFPSLYEGLPVTLVEAQTNGLKCFVSSNITKEVDITKNIYRIELAKSSNEWANIIKENCNHNELNRMNCILNNQFDIENTVMKLSNIYNSNSTEIKLFTTKN